MSAPRPGPVGAANLDDTPAFVQSRGARGEVDSYPRAVLRARAERGRQGRRHVHHEQIARVEYRGQVEEPPVLELAIRPCRDEQPDRVAGDAALLGRLVGFERARQFERQRVHATTVSSRAR